MTTTASPPRIRSFRDLLVWQRAMDLAEAVYRLTSSLPHHERYGLREQTRRAAAAIPANLAEGAGRYGLGEYPQHLNVANGSLKELETHLALGLRLQYYGGEEALQATRDIDEIGKMLGGLMRSLRAKKKPVTR